MSQLRVRILLAAALGCGLLALSPASDLARADPSPQAIRSDAHRIAVDIHRQVQSDAHQLHRQLLVTRDRVSLQLQHLGHRIQRWWSRARTS
jgi:hypothetical protein